MGHSSNQHSVKLWLAIISFLEELNDEGEAKLQQMFEKSIETIGHTDFSSTPIWQKYIDFETMRNNLAFVNVLCF